MRRYSMADKKTIVNADVLKSIKEKIESIEYGSITVVVHDGKVIQLETNEKTRFKN